MNAISHFNIMTAAYAALPEEIREELKQPRELVGKSGNYPDFFDDPTASGEKKKEIDPNWKVYTVYPDGLPAKQLHFFPAPQADQFARIPIYIYLFQRMIETCRQKKYDDFIKFAGCLSHAMGDCTQPAHIGPDANNVFLSQMLPVPDKPYLKNFHYHTSVEAVSGKCAPLPAPVSLGKTKEEAAWKLACSAELAVRRCRRFLIPTIEALFENDLNKAGALAVEPVTEAARMSLNAMYTAFLISENKSSLSKFENLCGIPPVKEFHDLVYGGAVINGNKNVPPNNVPVIPGKLRINGRITQLPGLGMLPTAA